MSSTPQLRPVLARVGAVAAPAAIAGVAAALLAGAIGAIEAAAVGLVLGLGLGVGAQAAAGAPWSLRKKADHAAQGENSDPAPALKPGAQIAADVAPALGRDDLAMAALTALSHLPAPAIVLDVNGFVMFSNPAADAEFGRPLANRHFAGVMRSPNLMAALQRAFSQREASEVSFSVRGLRERHLTAMVAPLEPERADGERLGDSAALTPGRHRASIAILIQDSTRIRRAEQLHRDFVANASHELKTPLAAVAGFIETLQGPARDDADARDRFLGLMARQAERMRRLLEDLLSLSRIELNEHVPPRDAVDLKRVIHEAAAASEPFEDAADGARIEVEAPSGLPPVRGDAGELTQLLINLLTNALKYGGEKRPVSVSVSRRAEPRPRLGVTVEDHGPGIPKEHIPRLTERFYRVNEPVNRGKGGTGLGLAIVKHIVARHRGELEIDSEPGRGSRFTVWLPYVDEQEGGDRQKVSLS